MFTKILLTVDTSEHSHKVVAATEELARTLGAKVHVLHVREVMSIGRGGPLVLDVTEDERNIAEEICRELQEKGILATFSRVSSYHGETGHVVVDAAKEAGADLIVVGSRGHSRRPGVLVGSVTNKVMHLAECSVLIIR